MGGIIAFQTQCNVLNVEITSEHCQHICLEVYYAIKKTPFFWLGTRAKGGENVDRRK
jgi:hypothetical protein